MRIGHRSALARLVVATAAIAGITFVSAPPLPVSAAPGDADPALTSKSGQPPLAASGELITYTINYECSSNLATDTCAGTTFRDPIPKFTNVYGELMPLQFVSVGTNNDWPDLHIDNTDPANPVVVGTAGDWRPGDSGSIFITVRVPPGMVPPGPAQTVTNQATIDDPDTGPGADSTSPQASTQINAPNPQWQIDKRIGPPQNPTVDLRMNRNYTWTISVCDQLTGDRTSSLWPVFEITDTLPPGFQFVSTENGGTFTDDAPLNGISDGAGTVTWTFDAVNRPPLTSSGCFEFDVVGRYPNPYTDSTPDDPADPANDDNVAGADKVNSVAGTGRTVDGAVTGSIGTDQVTNNLLGPTFGGGTSKSITNTANQGQQYVEIGDTVRFNLSTSLDSDFPVDQLTLTDGTWQFNGGAAQQGMPDTFDPTQVVPGTWNPNTLTAQIQESADGATWTDVGGPVNSGAVAMPLAASTRFVRWVWGGPADTDAIPANFTSTGQQIIGTIIGDPSDFGRYTNISTLLAHNVDPQNGGLLEVGRRTANDFYDIEQDLPHPGIDKSVSDTDVRPGETTNYSLSISNSADSTGPLVDPVITDCIPTNLVVQEASITMPAGWTRILPAPACPNGPAPENRPRTGLAFQYTGSLAPGASSGPITYSAIVSTASDPVGLAGPGRYENEAFVRPTPTTTFGHCIDTNPSCGEREVVVVPPIVELSSRKCVWGALDPVTGSDEPIFGPGSECADGAGTPAVLAQTLPGGRVLWRMEMTNTGNTDVSNVQFVDIFPFEGDTAVRTRTSGALNPRYSEWQPFLVTEIDVPDDWEVEYSFSANPCRPEVGGPTSVGVDCEAPGWFDDPSPYDLPNVRSVRFTYIGFTPGDVVEPGESVTFEWEMRAPVTETSWDDPNGGSSVIDPYEFLHDCDAATPAPAVPITDPNNAARTICPRAVNSFAYGASPTNLPPGVPTPARLFAEPPQVEVRATQAPNPNGIGDRVWYDANADGIQGSDLAAEPGIPGVRVELYAADANGNATGPLLYYTYTDLLGNYFFTGEDEGLSGDYVVRFYEPEGYYVSPADQTGTSGDQGSPLVYTTPGDPNAVPRPGQEPGTNTNDDSDVPVIPNGVDPLYGPYHDVVAARPAARCGAKRHRRGARRQLPRAAGPQLRGDQRRLVGTGDERQRSAGADGGHRLGSRRQHRQRQPGRPGRRLRPSGSGEPGGRQCQHHRSRIGQHQRRRRSVGR